MTPASGFTVLQFKPYLKNSLQGFVDLECPSGMVLRGCTLHVKGDSKWIGLPATKTSGDKWVAVVEIPDREKRDKFNEAACAAIDEYLAAQK